jgi:hypothetical protein
MTISERELQQLYGSAATAGNAALFVGAGLSLSAGFPSWKQLLEKPRQDAKIPDDLQDLPLVAQYYVQTMPGGRQALESHILHELSQVNAKSLSGHQWLAELPVDDVWTTNYDRLVELAMSSASVITSDDDLKERRRLQRRRVMKMHGSLSPSEPPTWEQPPVITRQDYEEYESRHPRLWAALRATYLTKSILFLGFSFTDPNIDVLLQLSRTLLHIGAPEHFTVLRRPIDRNTLRLHDLRVADLEQAGVAVCEVDDFTELEPIARTLVRRTREKLLFVSGSNTNGSDIADSSRRLGNLLAAHDISLASLAGPAAMRLAYALGRAHQAENRYDPARIQFYFRQSTEPPPALDERIGTAVYSDLDKEALRSQVLFRCRATLILGGGANTRAEVEEAKSLGLPIVPLARSKGVAKEVWSSMNIEDSGIALQGSQDESRDWELLNHEDVDIATPAAARLIRRAMYLEA